MPKYPTQSHPAFNDFVRGYIAAALWSSNDESNECGDDPLDDNYSAEDIDLQSLESAKLDCLKFMQNNWSDLLEYVEHIKYDPSQGSAWDYAGHDLWLTRNRHGAGFWDRKLGSLGESLTKSANALKQIDLYVGDDGKLYFSGY